MTNEQRIREEISTTIRLANYLVTFNEACGMFYSSDGKSFPYRADAITHEFKWLLTESDT